MSLDSPRRKVGINVMFKYLSYHHSLPVLTTTSYHVYIQSQISARALMENVPPTVTEATEREPKGEGEEQEGKNTASV
jgi:hypothetical protein